MELKNPKWSLGKKNSIAGKHPQRRGVWKTCTILLIVKPTRKWNKWVQPRRKYTEWNSYDIKMQVINGKNKQDYEYTKHFK